MVPPYLASIPDRDRIVARCRWLGALSPATARTETDLNLDHSTVWHELRDRGWIREGAPGTFYLAERVYPKSELDKHPYRLVLLVVVAIAALTLLVSLFERS